MDGIIKVSLIFVNFVIFSGFLFTIYHYCKFKIRSILPFTLAFFLHNITMFQFLLFHFFSGDSYLYFRAFYGRMSIFLTIVGMYALYEGVRQIGGFDLTRVDLFLWFSVFFLTGLIIQEIDYYWYDGIWQFAVPNSWDVVLFVVIMVYLLSRIALFTYHQINSTDILQKMEKYRIFSGLGLVFIGGIILPFEFVFSSHAEILWSLLPISLGLVIFTLSYLSNPSFLSISSLGVELLLVSTREGGKPVFTFNPNPNSFTYGSSLYAGWLKGILDVFDEITNDRRLTEVEFEGLYLIIYKNKAFNTFLFTTTKSSFLHDFLRELSDGLLTRPIKELQSLDVEETKKIINQVFNQKLV